MKAAWYDEIGEAKDVLTVGEVDQPAPGPGEVLVKVYASGVNPSDAKQRIGARGPMAFPRITPHSDGAGEIVEVGEGVDASRVGERIWTWNAAIGRANGTCAEYISLPSDQAVRMPDNTSYEAGACLGVPAATAYHAVFCDGSVKGQTILVTGGAGAVGHYAIQLARWGGAKVITTVSGDEKEAHAAKAKPDLIINYKTDDVVQKVKDFTNSEGVDRIVEVEFGGNLEVSNQILKLNGTIASYGSVGVGEPTLPFYPMMFNGTTVHMFLIYVVSEEARKNISEGVTRALEDDALVHSVAQTFPLDDIVAAHEAVESGAVIGKVIVAP